MILPESVDNLLKNPGLRFVAAVGFLMLLTGIIAGVLFNLADISGESFAFDGFWNLRYINVAGTLLAAGLWIALSITRRFEQPWWILVVVAFLAWMLIISPVSLDLPNFLANLFNIIGLGLRAAGLLAALATLDRAIPKLAPAAARPQAGVPAMGQHIDPLSDQAPAPAPGQVVQPQAQRQQAGGQAPGWYPDPRQQATWRWWDGSTWTENVG